MQKHGEDFNQPEKPRHTLELSSNQTTGRNRIAIYERGAHRHIYHGTKILGRGRGFAFTN